MELKISSKAEQPLLARTELQGVISFDSATPSRREVRKKLAEAMKSEESLVTVTSLKTDFGQKSAKVAAHIYRTLEDLERYASRTLKKRGTAGEKKAGEEKGAAQSAATPEKKNKEQKTGETGEKGAE